MDPSTLLLAVVAGFGVIVTALMALISYLLFRSRPQRYADVIACAVEAASQRLSASINQAAEVQRLRELLKAIDSSSFDPVKLSTATRALLSAAILVRSEGLSADIQVTTRELSALRERQAGLTFGGDHYTAPIKAMTARLVELTTQLEQLQAMSERLAGTSR